MSAGDAMPLDGLVSAGLLQSEDRVGANVSQSYVHGYRQRENERLQDQAGALVELLHSDTAYPAGCSVLEVGCGVGAQTLTLASRSPDAHFTSIDISAASVVSAQQACEAAGVTNVLFQQADIFALTFAPESFDHIFVLRSRAPSPPV